MVLVVQRLLLGPSLQGPHVIPAGQSWGEWVRTFPAAPCLHQGPRWGSGLLRRCEVTSPHLPQPYDPLQCSYYGEILKHFSAQLRKQGLLQFLLAPTKD